MAAVIFFALDCQCPTPGVILGLMTIKDLGDGALFSWFFFIGSV
jgi:hypothetical protein